jgi:peptide/nickel transport system permease protein
MAKTSKPAIIGKRILQMFPILLVVSVLAFALSNLSQGDVAATTIRSQGQQVTPETLEAMREELGLNAPLHVQYFNWLKRVIRFDFGISFQTKKPVIDEIMRRFPATLYLALTAMLLAVAISIPFALLCARYRDSPLDHAFRILTTLGTTIPEFWLGLMALYLFGVKLGIVPVISGNKWQNVFLPALTLSVSYSAVYIRMLRENLIQVMNLDYIYAARARGLSKTAALFKHGIKNAILPCITLVGVNFGNLLTGNFACETVFSWNGIGKYAVDSIRLKDLPVIQGYILIVAVTYILINLLLDILYIYIDPKIQME